MAGLWRVAVTVVMQRIVRTKARPPQTRCWPLLVAVPVQGTTPICAVIPRPLRQPNSGNPLWSRAHPHGVVPPNLDVIVLA